MKKKTGARPILRSIPVGLVAMALVLAALLLWNHLNGQRAASGPLPDAEQVVLEEAHLEKRSSIIGRPEWTIRRTATLTQPEDIAALWKELRGIGVTDMNRPMDSAPRLTITFYSSEGEILYQFHGDSDGTLASTSLGPGNRVVVAGYDYAALTGWMDRGI